MQAVVGERAALGRAPGRATGRWWPPLSVYLMPGFETLAPQVHPSTCQLADVDQACAR